MKSFLSLLVLVSIHTIAFSQSQKLENPKILLVTAHPDDDALFSGFVYRMTHEFGASVDLALVTNGEGGYRYSTLGEAIYGLELTKEEIGRKHLPRIRKMELMKGGAIVGIRNYFFLDEQDSVYTQNMEEVFTAHWDTARVKQRFRKILNEGSYDLVITMLATESTHGHHKGAAILMMKTVMEYPKEKRPIVLSGTMFSHSQGKPDVYTGFPNYPITSVSNPKAYFTFDRMQKFGFNDKLNYQIIGNWVIAEHKSQGSMQLLMNRGEIECYWYLDINDPKRQADVEHLFKQTSPQIGK
ncbi:PIG-L family deacetylase [bacterium]|nr:MAG: PIG-L family deacetylase [bacterium]